MERGTSVVFCLKEGSCPRSRVFCIIGVSFGILSLLLVSLHIAMHFYYMKQSGKLDDDRKQLQINYTHLAEEYDQLLTNYTDLLEERDQLHTNVTDIIEYRDICLDRYRSLAADKAQLLASYNNVSRQKNDLMTSYNNLENVLAGGWIQFQSSYYFFSNESKNWHDSRADCRQRGADLVIIHSREEQNFLTGHLQENSWIGLSDVNYEGMWKWVDGTLLTNGFWAPGEPNGHDNEDCAHHWDKEEWKWNDLPCSQPVRWTCELTF